MESGEKEMRRHFENTTIRNVKAAVNHSNETRAMVRGLEKQVCALTNNVQSYKDLLVEYRSQLVNLQQAFYLKGTTNGDNN